MIKSWGQSPHEWDLQLPIRKKAQRTGLPPSTLWGCSKKAVCNLEKGLHPESNHAGTLIHSASNTVRNKFLWFVSHPVYGMLFKAITWAKTTNLNFSVSEHRFSRTVLENSLFYLSPPSLWFADFSMLYGTSSNCSAPMCFSFCISPQCFWSSDDTSQTSQH